MGLVIGVDVGGTKIAAGVVDELGRIVAHAPSLPTSIDSAGTVQTIVDTVRGLVEAHPVEAIGIGVAGLLNAARSRILFAANLDLVDVPLKDLIERQTGLPTVLEGDANSAAWAEYRFGAGRGCSHMAMVTVGTGIGGGVVIDGVLNRGAHGSASEVGHMRVVPDGLACPCGGHGCWEQYASGPALVREARRLAVDGVDASSLLGLGDGTPEGITSAQLAPAAQDGDPAALAAFEIVGRWLGTGLASLAAVLDTGRFVLGGGVSEVGDLLLNPTRSTYLEVLSAPEARPVAPILLAEFAGQAGLVGAAELARMQT
jgi:glucokinase